MNTKALLQACNDTFKATVPHKLTVVNNRLVLTLFLEERYQDIFLDDNDLAKSVEENMVEIRKLVKE